MCFVVSRGHAFDQKPRETCVDDRKFSIARRATASRPAPKTYLQVAAGLSDISVVKALLGARSQPRQGYHLANVGWYLDLRKG